MTITVPIRTVSEANLREHWAAKARRVKRHRTAVALALSTYRRPPKAMHYFVTITRIAPRDLDTDNLASSLKATRDEIAAWIGLDDAPGSGIEWSYCQRRGELKKQYAVEIRIVALR